MVKLQHPIKKRLKTLYPPLALLQSLLSIPLLYPPQLISVTLLDRPVEVGDACSGPAILSQPNETTVTMLVEKLRS